MIQETSIKAYNELGKKIGERHIEIMDAIKEYSKYYNDITDRELASFMKQADPNYVRPRRHELVNKYKIIGFSQKRKCRVSGKTALAWKDLRTIIKYKLSGTIK